MARPVPSCPVTARPVTARPPRTAPARPPAARLSRVWPSREPSRGGPVGGILIANRGEIAIRIARAAAELGIATVAVTPRTTPTRLHVRRADEAVALPGAGAAAYLDIEQLVAAARDAGLRRRPPRLRLPQRERRLRPRCADAGITFVGPTPELLELFGDKAAGPRPGRRTRACRCCPAPTGPTDPRRRRAAFLAQARRRGHAQGRRPAAAGAACASSATPAMSWTAPARAAARRRRPPSATATLYVEQLLPRRPPHRGAGRSATATAR